jgi:hypothetical protein
MHFFLCPLILHEYYVFLLSFVDYCTQKNYHFAMQRLVSDVFYRLKFVGIIGMAMGNYVKW